MPVLKFYLFLSYFKVIMRFDKFLGLSTCFVISSIKDTDPKTFTQLSHFSRYILCVRRCSIQHCKKQKLLVVFLTKI